MNIKDYQYFKKLSESKSFSDTANFFSVSQPTITYSLKRLEDTYGISLVKRKSYANSLSLTYAGEQLLSHINKILLEDDLINDDMERIKRQKIVMGWPPIISNYVIPKVFDQLRDANLLNMIVPRRDSSRELLSELKNGKIDLSLLGSTILPQEDQLDYQLIKEHHFKFIASANRDVSNITSVEKLFNEDFISLDEKSVHSQVLERIIERYNVKPHTMFKTNDYRLMLSLVKQDKGFSFVTETAIQDVPGIQEIHINDLDLPSFYILFVYRHNMIGNQILKQLMEIFKNI
ncbi:LysR family transcriptional regulator [Companilactobacillus bobalius]|uniref:Malolactic fermentation system transcriptional activator n=2 Tax=Companilactobacillus bobalius TaxID=2801451 RepID=A0A202FFQ9_9LACO|nr:LysR family transcriptional regulator [Companilactobacillus bobalius]KAE9560265.1 malolactic fermentation transcriptional regulator [Companilactobacillus bobalius]KRK82999.1 malolactic fermentation transcriptional regulator [Companilactobacillus bobalius DSM 19674]OVE99316.1 Malolactic fermentation system transcriptional activator [Companilactobacillus bobalius]GEO57294.1 LysR family transcriptional regulator [Companilactobacillus paralimentarius]